MHHIDTILEELEERLPELAWKLTQLNTHLSQYQLPRGLFRATDEPMGAGWIEEIQADIRILKKQKQSSGAMYLAKRIQQKVNVLVNWCQLSTKEKPVDDSMQFGLNRLTTRQQWLQSLEEELKHLTVQHESLLRALERVRFGVQPGLIYAV